VCDRALRRPWSRHSAAGFRLAEGRRVLQHIDAVEALGNDPLEVAPDHWRHVQNRFTANEPPRLLEGAGLAVLPGRKERRAVGAPECDGGIGSSKPEDVVRLKSERRQEPAVSSSSTRTLMSASRTVSRSGAIASAKSSISAVAIRRSGIMITLIPAARAARTPLYESSKARHRSAGWSSSSAARRKRSG
jgi:Protein of unknown function (DUF2840)